MAVKLRFIIFIGAIILLSFCMLPSAEKDIFKLLGVQYLTVYTESKPVAIDAEISGNGYSFICKAEDYKNISDMQGITFKTDYSLEYIFKVLNLKVQSFQELELENRTINIYYCYSEDVGSGVILGNKKVNLQIAFDGENCILGIPLILGSY